MGYILWQEAGQVLLWYITTSVVFAKQMPFPPSDSTWNILQHSEYWRSLKHVIHRRFLSTSPALLGMKRWYTTFCGSSTKDFALTFHILFSAIRSVSFAKFCQKISCLVFNLKGFLKNNKNKNFSYFLHVFFSILCQSWVVVIISRPEKLPSHHFEL